MASFDEISGILAKQGLKVTPQRIAILEALIALNNHPAVEQIFEYIRDKNPNITLATVYKILDVLVDRGLVKTVKTDRDIRRYEAAKPPHHHIYHSDSDEIEDYVDNDLNNMLKDYFARKTIPGFKIEDIRVQVVGVKKTNTGE